MINHPRMLPRLEEPQEDEEGPPSPEQQQRPDGMFLWGLSRKPQQQHPAGQQERRASGEVRRGAATLA